MLGTAKGASVLLLVICVLIILPYLLNPFKFITLKDNILLGFFHAVKKKSELAQEDIEIENAYEEVDPELIEALENAGANIAAYHGSQVEADMIAQVEHDPKATAILITTSSKLAEEVKKELELQSKILPRRDIIEKRFR